jgi:thiol-disulfide isomerase/thioredoxin
MYKATIFIAMMAIFVNIQAQQLNQIMLDSNIQKDVLIGYCNREGLEVPIFSEYFVGGYADYNADPAVIENLMAFGHDYTIVIVLGTWCSDSQEQVPRFFKIADALGFPEENIRIICVDRKKHWPGNEDEIARFNIERVPTFIFFSDGEERGRMVETPTNTLEIDWLKILKNL